MRACRIERGTTAETVFDYGVCDIHTYDARGGLRNVDQRGAQGAIGRSRQFSYDGLGRLTTNTNPESGTICFGTKSGASCNPDYDENGNLRSRTDGRGIVTSYSYDGMNRVVSKDYSDGGNTPYTCLSYDSAPNRMGRLASEWTQAVTCPSAASDTPPVRTERRILAYDALGHSIREQQCVLGTCTQNDLLYSYNLIGLQTLLSDAAGVQFSLQYDRAGHIQNFTSNLVDDTHMPNLLSGITYTPAGAPQGAFRGNGL